MTIGITQTALVEEVLDIHVTTPTDQCRFCGNYVDLNKIPADRIIKEVESRHGKPEYYIYGVCLRKECQPEFEKYKKSHNSSDKH